MGPTWPCCGVLEAKLSGCWVVVLVFSSTGLTCQYSRVMTRI